jgi:hypothetical protein
MNMSAMSDADLARHAIKCRNEVLIAKTALAEVEAVIADRQAALAADVLTKADKQFGGSLTFSHNGVRYKAEVKKTIKWDSDKLREIASTLPWEQVQRLFDIEFSVTENTYKGIAAADPAMKARIDDARTVRLSPLDVKLIDLQP